MVTFKRCLTHIAVQDQISYLIIFQEHKNNIDKQFFFFFYIDISVITTLNKYSL